MLVLAVLFSLLGFFLCLIAHFYYVKSAKGMHYRYFYITYVCFMLGFVGFNLPHVGPTSQAIAEIFLVLGGTGFIGLILSLYYSMMSVSKN